MTEEDAKTKWCPMARILMERVADGKVRGFAAINSAVDDAGNNVRTQCVGSACMMWRTYGPFHPDYVPKHEETGGFCGLAGRP